MTWRFSQSHYLELGDKSNSGGLIFDWSGKYTHSLLRDVE